MDRYMDTSIHEYIHTKLAGRQIEYTRLPYKIYLLLSNGQKCFKTAVLDHVLAWKRKRGPTVGFFQYQKGLASPWIYPKHFSLLPHQSLDSILPFNRMKMCPTHCISIKIVACSYYLIQTPTARVTGVTCSFLSYLVHPQMLLFQEMLTISWY